METSRRLLLGNMLVQAGKIDEGQLQKSLETQREKDGYLGQVCLSNGFISEKELYQYLSQQLKIPYLQLGFFQKIMY